MGFFDFFNKSNVGTSSKAKQAQKILDEFRSKPTSAVIKRLTETVMDSNDHAVTDILLNSLKDENPGIRGLAIQSLGLVYDSRALAAVIEAYEETKRAYEKAAANNRMKKFMNIAYDHLQRAALSIHNSVGRDPNPIAIPMLMKIADDRSLPEGIRAFAVQALCVFRKDHAQVKEYLLKMGNDPSDAIKIAALDIDILRKRN